jgi:cupin 2 domain-containing protein
MDTGNLHDNIPGVLPVEMIETLAAGRNVRIERIVSRGHRSAPGFWYDQEEDEWVLVVKGQARLMFETGSRKVHLREGMYIHIPAHERHRVEWTTEDGDTIWLAVFYRR